MAAVETAVRSRCIPFRPQPTQVFPKSKLCIQSQNGSELHAAPLPKPILAAALRGTLLQAQVIREAACPFRISQTLQFLQMQGGNTSPQTCKTAHSAKKQQSGITFSKLQRPKLQKLSELTLISFNLQSSPTLQPTLSFQSLKAYAQQLVKQVYEHDSFGVGRLMLQFLGDLGKLRERVQQRLALLAYESESLQFKPFGQVEREMVKQWRRNVLLVALNTIWATRVQGCQFSSLQHFIDQYRKQIALVCNLTYFYFKPALVILDRKSVATFCYLQQQTAHKILNALENWPQIYRHKLLPLIRTHNLEQQFLMDLAYDPAQLSISPLYLNLHSPHPQLLSTTHKIKQFAHQCTIHGKIQLLRQIRATFLEEIEQSRDQIQRSRGEIGQQHPRQHSPLEKDDIIGCMIYCIVTGKVKQIQGSVQSLSELLGPNNQALSRRGVDSYRADLQSAVGYLCQQTEVHLITGHKPMEQEQIQLKINNKTTQLDDCG